ncbi:hypothetical protein [Desulfitobacterium sp.]|uniref:hypothetical protein n=1 Tax=Desulfitobacterium sp. TaxID=49981 RepID=UPI002C0F450F|nr:hypothetical protein [Desulfitobacterium sp.]HVJ49411.1 hypothetical protein [Desulfitobacterium sp.]
MLLQGIPEQIAVVALAFIIARIPFQWKRVIPIGIFLALVAYIVRLLPVPFGIHTIVLVILLFILLTIMGRGDVSQAIIATLISFLALVLFEIGSISAFMAIFKVSQETIFDSQLLRIVIGETHVILLFVFAYLLNRGKRRLKT